MQRSGDFTSYIPPQVNNEREVKVNRLKELFASKTKNLKVRDKEINEFAKDLFETENQSILIKRLIKYYIKKFHRKYPELNDKTYLPMLKIASYVATMKYFEDASVFNEDFNDLIEPSKLLKLEKEFLKGIDYELSTKDFEDRLNLYKHLLRNDFESLLEELDTMDLKTVIESCKRSTLAKGREKSSTRNENFFKINREFLKKFYNFIYEKFPDSIDEKTWENVKNLSLAILTVSTTNKHHSKISKEIAIIESKYEGRISSL